MTACEITWEGLHVDLLCFVAAGYVGIMLGLGWVCVGFVLGLSWV